MTFSLSDDMVPALQTEAERRNVSVEEVIHVAVATYLKMEAELQAELDGWQGLRDEVWELPLSH